MLKDKTFPLMSGWPQGLSFERNPGVATELVRSNVDAIVTWATEATMAASRATLTIPIVMVGVGDPLGTHFIASLAHPGGNITGVTNISPDLAGKLIERFVEIVPGMKSVGVVANLRNPVTTNVSQQTEVAIRNLGLRAEVVEARVGEELESAFAALSTKHVGGIVLIPEPFIIEHRVWIAELALKGGVADRVPTPRERRSGWPPVVWAELEGPVASSGCLCRSHPERRPASGNAGGATDQI
jgi:putative tryptophan/tyrosine transport system substrate-binding protein